MYTKCGAKGNARRLGTRRQLRRPRRKTGGFDTVNNSESIPKVGCTLSSWTDEVTKQASVVSVRAVRTVVKPTVVETRNKTTADERRCKAPGLTITSIGVPRATGARTCINTAIHILEAKLCIFSSSRRRRRRRPFCTGPYSICTFCCRSCGSRSQLRSHAKMTGSEHRKTRKGDASFRGRSRY